MKTVNEMLAAYDATVAKLLQRSKDGGIDFQALKDFHRGQKTSIKERLKKKIVGDELQQYEGILFAELKKRFNEVKLQSENQNKDQCEAVLDSVFDELMRRARGGEFHSILEFNSELERAKKEFSKSTAGIQKSVQDSVLLEKTERLLLKVSECIAKQAERDVQGHLQCLQEKNLALEKELSSWKVKMEAAKS